MEIQLQAYKNYNIEDWDGTVEISGLHITQSKRLAGSRNLGSLFRKMLKVYNGKLSSPVELPDGLLPGMLDLGDFMQLAIGIAAMTGGRSFQHNMTCPYCKALNPRVIDRLDVFKPTKPEIEGGTHTLSIESTKQPKRKPKSTEPEKKVAEIQIECNYTSVDNYLAVYKKQETLTLDEAKTNDVYKQLLDVEDEEDLRDLRSIILDVGIVASGITVKEKEDFNSKLIWLGNMKGEKGTKDYNLINDTISKLSAVVQSEYKTTCVKCDKELEADFQPTDYFFAMG